MRSQAPGNRGSVRVSCVRGTRENSMDDHDKNNLLNKVSEHGFLRKQTTGGEIDSRFGSDQDADLNPPQRPNAATKSSGRRKRAG